MKIPRINTKTTNMEMTTKLQTLLDQKILPLGKFLPEHGDTKCDVELEKLTDQQSGKIYRAEINLYNGGTLYRTEATEEQIEHAIDEARDQMKNELSRTHDKKQSQTIRGMRSVKRMLRFGRK